MSLKTKPMNYDISMCDNDDCTMKEQCRRYITYQRYKQDTNKNKRRLVFMVDTEHLINGECDNWLPENIFWR